MRAVAAVASACLLAGGCTWVARRPSGASVIADMSLGVAAYFVAQDVACEYERGEEYCDMDTLATVMFGGPFMLLAAITGAYALTLPAEPDASAVREREVLAVSTDETTFELGRQARDAARAGDCVAARDALDEIAARDADHHIALLASGALEACT